MSEWVGTWRESFWILALHICTVVIGCVVGWYLGLALFRRADRWRLEHDSMELEDYTTTTPAGGTRRWRWAQTLAEHPDFAFRPWDHSQALQMDRALPLRRRMVHRMRRAWNGWRHRRAINRLERQP
jgi:hypothetical protein